MMRIVGAAIGAMLAAGLTAAPAADADANDDEFIEHTDRIIYGGNAVDGDRWWGYSDVPPNVRIDAAHTACALMDEGVGGAEINDTLVALLGSREHAGYFAAWFEQSAITHYCPRHTDNIGTI